MYNYGLIGNCQASALVSNLGSIDWLCMPRPDSPPIFGRILDPDGGYFSIEVEGSASATQSYIPNTNVLITDVTCEDKSQFEIVDFCPRYLQFGRIFRPVALNRVVRPKRGSPRVRVVCHPVVGWEKTKARPIRGNSHVSYDINGEPLRLTSNMPLTYLCDETFFNLKEELCFALTWSFPVREGVVEAVNSSLLQTVDYWKTWVKHCSIPSSYQKETIRSALTLKLHCYEDTGAILAALTTSLPEIPGQERNWDYRFCWLRDAYFVLTAFHNLGHFEEAEQFIRFVLGLAESHKESEDRLRPVYKLDGSLPLPEIVHNNWNGFLHSNPVRSNNQAAEHVQNDVYGEMVLALAPIFFDERFQHLRTAEHERLLNHFGRLCAKNISQPDAGLWEIRNGWQEHSFSNLMCWAGLERISRIQKLGYLQKMDFDLASSLKKAELAVRNAIVDGSLRNGPTDPSTDSALLHLTTLRFPDAQAVKGTVYQIAKDLSLSGPAGEQGFLYRYRRKDDFGEPDGAFLICSFWLVQALAKIGDVSRAREIMNYTMTAANTLGLFSEHYHPKTRAQHGNFPQAYSHVGQINAAFAVSSPWEDIL